MVLLNGAHVLAYPLLLILCAQWSFARRHSSKRALIPPAGYINPAAGGGQMLTSIPVTYPAGLGEPINAIISAKSDPAVLVNQEISGGLLNYFLSFNFSIECLGQHLGGDQSANLGDGNGFQNETAVIRYNYGNPHTGSCTETIQGGNHFRYWIQNGTAANTGAIFLAVSYEQSMTAGHDIVPNGYDFGRDWLIGNATSQTSLIPTLDLSSPTPALTNSTTNVTTPGSPGFLPQYTGSTSYGNYTYQTTTTYIQNLLQNSSTGINHYITVEMDGRPAIDGLVALLEVQITSRPNTSSPNTTRPQKASNGRKNIQLMYPLFLLPLLPALII
ncbi:hypothetical protein BS47DRAFT_1314570 [Hydnum rufescens UP504]|uniref:Uncharacterized protein n=1 Tax=Hydnum rufescens UP504 TaxID=1448309 RepID=A0A9P6B3Y8_9AGAM|nr:hypothetical protein BS47DRAFT_1314570 [Hydnum rufescens UP504]